MFEVPKSAIKLSPHAKIYNTLTDYINSQRFAAVSPIYSSPMPDVFVEEGLEPLFDEPDNRAMGRTRLTIADMINLRFTGIPFDLVNKKDAFEIKKHLDEYLRELHLHKEHPTASAYLKKVAVFQSELTRCCTILIKRKDLIKFDKTEEKLLQRILKKGFEVDAIVEKYYAHTDECTASDEDGNNN